MPFLLPTLPCVSPCSHQRWPSLEREAQETLSHGPFPWVAASVQPMSPPVGMDRPRQSSTLKSRYLKPAREPVTKEAGDTVGASEMVSKQQMVNVCEEPQKTDNEGS